MITSIKKTSVGLVFFWSNHAKLIAIMVTIIIPINLIFSIPY